ncbi:MAG: RNA polymerase sigma factor [Candidatus Omnitrophota bacterium]
MQEISKEIIIAASAGDVGSFEKIYQATSGFVYAVALRVTNDREDAQEITQDVFIKIHKNLKWFQFRSSLKTWIYRIAVNTALTVAKRRAKERSRMVVYDDALANTIAAPENPAKEINQENLDVLLAPLNPQQRSCMVLRSIEGLSYKEIAGLLQININTVRTRLNRARRLLLARATDGGNKQ